MPTVTLVPSATPVAVGLQIALRPNRSRHAARPSTTLTTPRSDVDLRLADELGDEQVGRIVEHLVGGAELLHHAGVHHREPVGQRQRLDLVVGDHDRGVAEFALQHLQLAPHPLARRRVEVAQRLVEQQHRRVAHQRPRQRDALLLTAGQAGGPQVEQIVHLQPRR